MAKQKKSSAEVKYKKIKTVKPDANADLGSDVTVEEKLVALCKLQTTCSKIDKVRVVRGELPLEVRDLEDEFLKIQTRIENFEEIIKGEKANVTEKQEAIKKSTAQITRYKEQLNNVRNNREFDALTKEVEYEELDIQLSEKKIREFSAKIEEKEEEIQHLRTNSETVMQELNSKKAELNSIIAETEKEETELLEKVKEYEQNIDSRMLASFYKIRKSMRNGLAVVKVDRNACGGCFSKISPQRQLDIRMHKKIIVCEFCGRILIDDDIIAMSEKESRESESL
ncbi:MAG: C4-type zinc ribbon domain-containing protein [Lentimicrobiaceae bacterium]|nr:C4-type zinc ribbon domain-containing protein [Lentimicrobiaceae bacterium]